MPYYRNKLNQKITVFIKQAQPVKFMPGETKLLKSKDLHKQYPKYIQLISDELVAKKKEGSEVVKEEEKKEVISEVKQPTSDKVLVDEPVQEEKKSTKPKKKTSKKKSTKKKQKISEGYSFAKKEVTVAISETDKPGE